MTLQGGRDRERQLRTLVVYVRGVLGFFLGLAFWAGLMFLLHDGKSIPPRACYDGDYGDCEAGTMTERASGEHAKALGGREREEKRLGAAIISRVDDEGARLAGHKAARAESRKK
jgi:hypothetical protein